jgi:hypothetical protein
MSVIPERHCGNLRYRMDVFAMQQVSVRAVYKGWIISLARQTRFEARGAIEKVPTPVLVDRSYSSWLF